MKGTFASVAIGWPAFAVGAGAICLGEGGENALPHALAEGLGATVERGDLAEHDPVLPDAVFGERSTSGDEDECGCKDEPKRMDHLRISSVRQPACPLGRLWVVLPNRTRAPHHAPRWLSGR